MAAVETIRILKQVNVGCERHGRIETRVLGQYAPEWVNLDHATLTRLLRQQLVEKTTVEESELEKWEEFHESTWGSQASPSEQGEVSETEEVENTSKEEETDEPEEIVEQDIDLGPEEPEDEPEPDEDEEQKTAAKKVARRRSPRRTRSKT